MDLTGAVELRIFDPACIDAASGARDRNRTGTPAIHEAADFKSAVSTYFTTRAVR